MSFNILVVDDTKFMRKMLTDILKQYGYQVVGEAENGRQAVQRYEELRPDVVLMDITMPEMDGIDAMKEIRRIDSDAVVLICSAMSQQDLISDALKAGANGYVMKPFKPNRVNEIIRKYGFRRPNHDPTPKATEAPVEERPEQPVAVPALEPELEATVATESPEPTAAALDAEPRVASEPGQEPEEALAEESVELPAVALEPESEPEEYRLEQSELEAESESEEQQLEQSELEAMPDSVAESEAEPLAEAEEVAAEESAELPAVSPELELAAGADAEEESLELAAVEPEPESQAAPIEEISVLAAVETPVALEPESTEEELQEPASLAGSDAAEAGDLVLPLSILEQPSGAELSLDELNELTLELATAEPDELEALQADSVPALEAAADRDPEPEPELEQEAEPALEQAAEPDLEPELVETQPQPESAANEPKPVQDWMEAGKRAFKTVEGGKIINLFRGNGPMKNFTSSYMCNWNEEVNGEMSQFLVVATEAENKISIEVMSNGTERQTIHLSIDGFNQLGAWLQDKLGNGAPSVRELSKRENY